MINELTVAIRQFVTFLSFEIFKKYFKLPEIPGIQ